VRQFNVQFGLDQDKFNESVRQFNESEAISAAGLTGTYQGQQTQQAQQQGFSQAQAIAGMTGYWNPNAPGIWGGGTAGAGAGAAPAQMSWDQLSNLMRSAAGGNYNDAAGKAAFNQVTGWNGGSTPANLSPGQISQIINAGTNGQFPSYAALTGQAQPAAAAGAPVGGQGQMTTAYQQQLFAQQLDAINAAAALQANPFRQQQVIGQLGQVLGGQPVAGFSAPNTVAGVGTQGGTGPNTGMAYMQQMIQDIQNGPNSANSQNVQGVLDAIPTPNKINSADFLRSAPSTQNMILQGMQERYGLDPADSLAQIKNTLPSFQAPSTFGTIKG